MAAKSRLDHGFKDDCNFVGRRTNTLGLKEETLAPVSRTASNGIAQAVTPTKALLSSTTEYKHSVCLRFI